MTRANVSTVIKEGVKMCCKAVTAKFLTVVGLLYENSKEIIKPKSYPEAYLSISKYPIAVTSSSPVIYISLSISLFFSSILRSNSRSHQSIG